MSHYSKLHVFPPTVLVSGSCDHPRRILTFTRWRPYSRRCQHFNVRVQGQTGTDKFCLRLTFIVSYRGKEWSGGMMELVFVVILRHFSRSFLSDRDPSSCFPTEFRFLFPTNLFRFQRLQDTSCLRLGLLNHRCCLKIGSD